MNPEEAAAKVARKLAASVECLLITAIEEIENRVPTNDEIRRFGSKETRADGTAFYKWRDVPLFGVRMFPKPSVAFEFFIPTD